MFWDHLYQDKDGLRKTILQLIEFRKKWGIHAR